MILDPEIVPELIDAGIREAIRDRVAPTRTRTGTVQSVDYLRKTALVKVDGDVASTQTRLLCDAFVGARVVVDFTTGGGVWCKGIIGGSAGWTDYTPIWSSTIAQPVLSNGTLRGSFMRVGSMCWVRIELIFGNLTNGGSGDYRFTLPFVNPTGLEQEIEYAKVFSAFDTASYYGWALVPPNSNLVTPFMPNSSADNRTFAMRNADASTAVNTGVPHIAGHYPLENGGKLVVRGSYRVG